MSNKFNIYINISVIDLILKEREDDDVIDKLESCRSGKNTIKPVGNRTGGILCISTCSGFIINLKEYAHRETCTEVCIDVVETFIGLGKQSHIDYFERMDSIGYDHMCGLCKRIISMGKQGLLTSDQIFFWTKMMAAAFSDGFHIQKHICELCHMKYTETVILNGECKKFDNIFRNPQYLKMEKKKNTYTKVNDEIVEQYWRYFNAMRFMKRASSRTFKWLLFLKRRLINKNRKQTLIKKGYEFVDIQEFTKLRNMIDSTIICEWDENFTLDSIAQQYKHAKLPIVERIRNNNHNSNNNPDLDSDEEIMVYTLDDQHLMRKRQRCEECDQLPKKKRKLSCNLAKQIDNNYNINNNPDLVSDEKIMANTSNDQHLASKGRKRAKR